MDSPVPLYGTWTHLDLRHGAQEFGRKGPTVPPPGGRVIELSRPRPGERDELLHVLHGSWG